MKHTDSIGDLKYDSLAEFLEQLSSKLASDSYADHQRGRPKLSHELSCCAENLLEASRHIAKAWKICAPFMKTSQMSELPSSSAPLNCISCGSPLTVSELGFDCSCGLKYRAK